MTMITTSVPGGSPARVLRNAARVTRFARFRKTALPTLGVTVIPSRGSSEEPVTAKTRRFLVWIFRPSWRTLLNWTLRRSRWSEVKGPGVMPRRGPHGSLLRDRYGEPLPPLGPAGIDDLPPGGGGHAGAEPMLPDSLRIMRLVCSLHSLTPWLVLKSPFSTVKIMGKSLCMSMIISRKAFPILLTPPRALCHVSSSLPRGV